MGRILGIGNGPEWADGLRKEAKREVKVAMVLTRGDLRDDGVVDLGDIPWRLFDDASVPVKSETLGSKFPPVRVGPVVGNELRVHYGDYGEPALIPLKEDGRAHLGWVARGMSLEEPIFFDASSELEAGEETETENETETSMYANSKAEVKVATQGMSREESFELFDRREEVRDTVAKALEGAFENITEKFPEIRTADLSSRMQSRISSFIEDASEWIWESVEPEKTGPLARTYPPVGVGEPVGVLTPDVLNPAPGTSEASSRSTVKVAGFGDDSGRENQECT
jgi:hypothetical protein